MIVASSGMKIPWNIAAVSVCSLAILLFSTSIILQPCNAQDDYENPDDAPVKPPKEQEECDGIFVSYTLEERERELPYVKNVTAQGWAFTASVFVLNAGAYELKSWQIYVGFQYNELLVSADGAVVVDGDGFPIRVGKNGTHLAGYPQADLKTAIDTASDMDQMTAKIKLKGTQFGGKKDAKPMPKTIKLVNDGYKCPAPKIKKGGTYIFK